MCENIHIGTSGWNYEHWQGLFYPDEIPPNHWFDHYAATFETVEINNTFYQQPDEETFIEWRNQAPDGFQYAVKANRYLTHMKKLNEPEEPLDHFLQGARLLKDHLGPVLFQLPPKWNKNLNRLETFAKALPSDLKSTIEFRERDWLDDDVYDLMADYGLSLCVHDMLPRHPRRVTGPIVYVRFHGSGRKYGGKYRPSRLQGWADWLRDVAVDREAYVYFNNDANGYAVRDARQFREMIAT